MADYTRDLVGAAAELWEAGSFDKDPPLSGEWRGRVMMLREIVTLKFGSIELFYRQLANLDEDEDPNAAKRPAQD